MPSLAQQAGCASPALGAKLAGWISGVKPETSDEGYEMAEIALIDGLACIISGSLEPSVRALTSLVTTGAELPASIVRERLGASASDATLINATAAHALDYDDISWLAGHPGVFIVPAALAVAEETGASGSDLLRAIAAGYEVAKFAGALTKNRLAAEFLNFNSHCGALGALASSSVLLDSDEARTAVAMGLLSLSAAPPPFHTGTDARPLAAGLAASNALKCAQLADRGASAPADHLTGPNGYLGAYMEAPDECWETLVHSGYAIETNRSDQGLKPYPSCAGTHPVIDGLLHLRPEIEGRLDRIEAIRVEIPRSPARFLRYTTADNALEAKFSLEVMAALALVDGAAGLAQYTDESVRRLQVRQLAERVRWTVNEELSAIQEGIPEGGLRRLPATVAVVLPERELRVEVMAARGNPANRMLLPDVIRKLEECAERGLPDTASRTKLVSLVSTIRSVDNVGVLARTLAGR